jgi:hypothetical protein
MKTKPIFTITAVAFLVAYSGLVQADTRFPEPGRALDADKIVCWMADGAGMQPPGFLEDYIVDRLGANGTRIAVEPGTTRSLLRVLGMQDLSVFDPVAAHKLAVGAGCRWVLWVKIVSREMESKKLLGVPYLFNHRRLDAHVFFDVRLYDAQLRTLLGSKRLKLSDKGEGTWQVTEDERLDPAYNNDPVEIHGRQQRLDWEAAAMISGYCASVLDPKRMADIEKKAMRASSDGVPRPVVPSSPAVPVVAHPD